MKAPTALISRARARTVVVAAVLVSVGVASGLLTMTLAVAAWVLIVGEGPTGSIDDWVMMSGPGGLATTLVGAWETLQYAVITSAPLEPDGFFALLCAPGGLVAALAFGWRCIRARRDRAGARTACLVRGQAAGVAATALIYLTTEVFVLVGLHAAGGTTSAGDLVTDLTVGVLVVSTLGFVVGLPLGLALGAVMIVPIRLGCEHSWAHDSVERSASACGGWLACVSGAAAALAAAVVVVAPGRAHAALALAVVWVLTGAAGLAVHLWGRRRRARRARWVARVTAGQEPGWAVVELGDEVARADRGLRPFLGGDRGAAHFALARLETVPAGAYRDVDHPVPVALVASS
jgi:hypothetical protein